MKLRIAPPVLTFLSAILMWAIANYLTFATMDIDLSWRKSIFLVFVALGCAAAFAAFFNFRSSKTTIDPMKPEKASVLVTEGIFQFTRNPMYLGLLSCLIAWAIYLNNFLTLLVVVGFFFYMTQVQIKAEEKALNEKFGEDYQAYMQRVRRWL
ncbi:MAG: isoprenylcysteine carboxylmethyltransferase family protein [Bacteroidota bacterium]